jgi:hypothetical protein
VAGVVIAFLAGSDVGEKFLQKVTLEHGISGALSQTGYFILGTLFFALMGWILYRVAMKRSA